MGDTGSGLELLERAPGPSPWYLRGAPSPAPGFEWQDAGRGPDSAGKAILAGKHGPVLLLDFYHYVLSLSDGELLVWYQKDDDPATGRVYGDGIRLLPFVLDGTLRQVDRFFEDGQA